MAQLPGESVESSDIGMVGRREAEPAPRPARLGLRPPPTVFATRLAPPRHALVGLHVEHPDLGAAFFVRACATAMHGDVESPQLTVDGTHLCASRAPVLCFVRSAEQRPRFVKRRLCSGEVHLPHFAQKGKEGDSRSEVGMPCTKTGSVSGSKKGSDMAREASWPWASRVTVSSRPLSHSEDTLLGPEGMTSTQPAVSISSITEYFAGSSTPKEAAGVTYDTYTKVGYRR